MEIKFIYEVMIYLIYKDRVELHDTRRFGTDRKLNVKSSEYRKVDKELTVAKFIKIISPEQESDINETERRIWKSNSRGRSRNGKSKGR